MALFESDNIISWNFANWVTIGLIALTLFFALGLLQKFMQGKVNNADNQS